MQVVNDFFELIEKSIQDNPVQACIVLLRCFYPTALEEARKSFAWKIQADKVLHNLKNFHNLAEILIPLNIKDSHWALIAICRREKKVKYYDSLKKPRVPPAVEWIRAHFAEVFDQSIKKWDIEVVKDIPKQNNGVDCGVFVCQYAKCLANGSEFNFQQSDIPEIRKQMKRQLLSGSLTPLDRPHTETEILKETKGDDNIKFAAMRKKT